MKALLINAYGSPEVLKVGEMPKPQAKDDEVLIRVVSSSINAGDWHLMRADPFLVRLAFGLFKPKVKVLGADVAGVVEAIGSKVSDFNLGDRVFGDVSNCGFGAFAEFVTCRPQFIAKIPPSIHFDEAAAIPAAGTTAWQSLTKHGRVQAGEEVLIQGASGGIGTFAVQLAKAQGAHVTAVCGTASVSRAKELGADRVIDYKQTDFSQEGRLYDLIVAVNGDQPLKDYKRCLKPGGRFVLSGGSMRQFYSAVSLGPIYSLFSDKSFKNFLLAPNRQDLDALVELVLEGKLRPIIVKTCSLEEIPMGIAYLEEGHAKGKVIVKIGSDAA